MDIVNAIAKVRFGSAKAQCVHLHQAGACRVELICMEPGQKLRVSSGEWTYYVIIGTACLTSNDKPVDVPTGQLVVAGLKEVHTLSNPGERRLVCLAIWRTE
jgi:mannose-6-phosphate isomerase-like protein (cupin superfamily)